MKKKKVLFIEGTDDTANGDLSKGFSALLSQLLEGNMPKIIMGTGKSQTIDKFKNSKATFSFLLIDLDEKETFKEQNLKQLDLVKYAEWVFFMIQEMEAWFISQPHILDEYYKDNISPKLKHKHPKKIKKPSELLKQLTRKNKKGVYHKVKHAIDLLNLLDAQQLRIDFEEFDRLIKKLQNTTNK